MEPGKTGWEGEEERAVMLKNRVGEGQDLGLLKYSDGVH